MSAPVRQSTTGGTSVAPRRACRTRSTAVGAPRESAADAAAARRERRGRRPRLLRRSARSTSAPTTRSLAWSADIDGNEHYTLRVRDLDAGTDLDDESHDTTRGPASPGRATASTSSTSIADEQERPYRRVAPPARHAAARRRRGLRRATTSASTSASARPAASEWIVIHSGSKQTSEDWLHPRPPTRRRRRASCAPRARGRRVPRRPLGRPLRHPHQPRRRGLPRDDGAARRPGEWTRADRPRAGPADHRRSSRSPTSSRSTSGTTPSRGSGSSRRRRTSRCSAVDAEPHDVDFGPNAQWDTPMLRVTHQSLTTPADVLDVDVATGDVNVVKQTPTPERRPRRLRRRSGCGPQRPTATQVPVDIVRHVDTPLDGTAPCLRVRLRHLRGRRCRRGSRSPACRCSTAASCGRSSTHAAAASSAARGTSTASCSPSATRSPTPSPPCEHLVATGVAAPRPARDPRRQRRRPARRRVRHDATASCSARPSPRCRSSTS